MPFSRLSAARAAKWGACALTILCLGWAATPALAQKSGGTLRLFHRDSPASGSIHEEATISAVAPFSAVFSNLIRFNQHEKQNRPDFIKPELSERCKWNNDYPRLPFNLPYCVKWHDGKPF